MATTDLVPQIPPARSAVLERTDDGIPRFTRSWYRYFSVLQQNTSDGMAAIDTGPDLTVGAFVDPTLANAVADVAAMQNEIRELRETVFELQKDINGLRQSVAL